MDKVYNYLNQFITDGAVIGMGSGSTIEGYIPSVKEHVEHGMLNVTFVPTSKKTENALEKNQLEVSLDVSSIDLTIDGADQFKHSLKVVKGGGGSLLREKQIGYFSKRIIIVAKDSKEISTFEGVKIPVEVNPFLYKLTKQQIIDLGGTLSDRMDGAHLFETDNGNYIVDCIFNKINDVDALQNVLLNIPGVIETGIFNDFIEKIVAFNNAEITIHEEKSL